MNSKESLLNNLTYLATQICNKRGWIPGRIEELLETNSNTGILGLNIQKGKIIQIRLYDNRKQIEWYHLVGTLAHELAHNLIAGHTPDFFKEMDKIHDEMEKLDEYERIFAEMTGSYYSKGFTVVSKGRNSNSIQTPISAKSTTKNTRVEKHKETKAQRRAKILYALANRGLV